MDGATYLRRVEGDAVVYDISSIPNKMARNDRYVKWGFGALVLGYVFAVPLLIITTALHLPMILSYLFGVVLAFLLIKRLREGKTSKKTVEVMGRRGKSIITLSRRGITGKFLPAGGGSQDIDVPLSDVRRFRRANTFQDAPNTKLSGGGQSSALGVAMAQPTAGRAGALLIAHDVGRMRAEKVAIHSYAVMFDYQNSSSALADGLDRLTATNLFEDVQKDYQTFIAP